MKTYRIYICSGIFLLLTAVKFISPAISSVILDGMREVLCMEQEQTETIMTLGSSLTEYKLENVFREIIVKAENTPAPTAEIKHQAVEVQTPKPQPTATPTPEPTENPKIAAFMASQEAFSDRPVPANVSYDYKNLPFDYVIPVSGSNSSGFGYRLHPIQNEVKYHYGTDLAANTGEEIHAFADGKIYAIGENDSFGKYVIIDHADGYRTLYAHCSKHCKGSGEVKKGDVIALVGETGAATGPHLHFELMHNDTYLNPEFYI